MSNSDNDKRESQTFVKSHKPEISFGLVAPIAAILVTLAIFQFNTIMDIFDRISGLDRVVASNTATHISTGNQLDSVDTRISRIESRVERCSTQIAELRALSRDREERSFRVSEE